QLGPTPNPKAGDLAFPCFALANILKSSPVEIAKKLGQALNSNPFVKNSLAAGPYLNFFINTGALFKDLAPQLESGAFFRQPLVERAPKTIIEFSQPNTHKEMHVGHMRNLCLGDALIKAHRYAGVETISTTFPGDVGTHVAKCLWYLKNINKEEAPKERKGAWLGSMYTQGSNFLKERQGTPQEEEIKKEMGVILKQLEQKSGEYFELWKETRQWSIELMNQVYEWANVDFDTWYWESDVDSDSVALIKKYYEKGLFVKDQGAIGIDLSEDKLGFCLVLKSDGSGLYTTKDIELARRKFEDQKVDKSIYVVDNRQALHFKQVFKTLEKMGFDKAKDCYHLQYEMVELPDGAMSSRKGNVVPLQSLIDQMVAKIKNDYLEKYQEEWSREEINNTANTIAAGAIKFGMNRIDPNKKIVFDMNEWLKLEGESGPYIQYVYARIQSMLAKLDNNLAADYDQLEDPIEKQTLLLINQFNDVVELALKNYKTSVICNYLYDLSKAFNQFYANCPVAKAPTKELAGARRDLAQACALTLKEGLALLGIKAPKRM
ncbi:MAG: arginine--tRNA ligase, partial [Bacteriovoracaceae bacterium]